MNNFNHINLSSPHCVSSAFLILQVHKLSLLCNNIHYLGGSDPHCFCSRVTKLFHSLLFCELTIYYLKTYLQKCIGSSFSVQLHSALASFFFFYIFFMFLTLKLYNIYHSTGLMLIGYVNINL